MTPDQIIFALSVTAGIGWLGAFSMAAVFCASELENQRLKSEAKLLGDEVYRLRMQLGELDEKA